MCDGNGEGCYRMRFSRMDGGSVRWPQKCLDVRATLKRGIYRVAVTSSWSSGLEIDHGAACCGLLPALIPPVGEPGKWSGRPGKASVPGQGFYCHITERCPLCNFLGKVVLVSFQLIFFSC